MSCRCPGSRDPLNICCRYALKKFRPRITVMKSKTAIPDTFLASGSVRDNPVYHVVKSTGRGLTKTVSLHQ